MIKNEILERLMPITEEELTILNGSDTIDSTIYTDNTDLIISSKKLLLNGKLISVRKHITSGIRNKTAMTPFIAFEFEDASGILFAGYNFSPARS